MSLPPWIGGRANSHDNTPILQPCLFQVAMPSRQPEPSHPTNSHPQPPESSWTCQQRPVAKVGSPPTGSGTCLHPWFPRQVTTGRDGHVALLHAWDSDPHDHPTRRCLMPNISKAPVRGPSGRPPPQRQPPDMAPLQASTVCKPGGQTPHPRTAGHGQPGPVLDLGWGDSQHSLSLTHPFLLCSHYRCCGGGLQKRPSGPRGGHSPLHSKIRGQ